jgi:phosphoglycolate phosphatase
MKGGRLVNKSRYYKAVLFDFDYTLADSSRGICECFAHALTKMGYDVPADEEICKTIGKTLTEAFVLFTANEAPEAEIAFRSAYKEKADIVMTEKTVMFDDVDSTLEYLHEKGLKCAIISTKYRYRITEALERDGIAKYFDLLVGGEDVTVHKPEPEGLLKAMECLDLKAEDCVYVGDSTVDAQAAENAGVDFIGVLSGATTREQMEAYSNIAIINRLSDIREIIR